MSGSTSVPPVPSPAPCMEVTNENWQKSVGSWSFQNVNRILRTVPIPRIHGDNAVAPLNPASVDPAEILTIKVKLYDNKNLYTVQDIIDATDTDGWIVLHNNEVVIEQYPGMSETTKHLLMSVTKTLTATVAGALVGETINGKRTLDPDREVTQYVPALRNSGYVGATVRHVLDMVSDIKFSEDYLDPKSEVRRMEAAAEWGPPSNPPETLEQFLYSLTAKGGNHGERFEYRSCETAVLGLVCEAAYQQNHNVVKSFAELTSELLWSKLGAEHDAYVTVDGEGTAAYDGGICATLRDLSRFGAMICRGGKPIHNDNLQVVSQGWVNDIFENGSVHAFERGPNYDELDMPGGKFRSMFWSPTGNRDVVICIGVHGQLVYINRATNTVGVKFSSWARPVEEWNGRWKGFSAVSMFEAINAYLVPATTRTTAGMVSR
ncbi:serine hydrolase domain-containing protein [Nocardia brasiliensis]|uniref:serine hydrolase domain-containing protein n=1 Tax=Nocardia brasiliensis TaxID=37326 RepID=UPI00366F4D3C